MATIYIILKIAALLSVIIVPLAGPERKKEKAPIGLSNICVNESGFLEYMRAGQDQEAGYKARLPRY